MESSIGEKLFDFKVQNSW